MTASDDIAEVQLDTAGKEILHIGLAERSDGLLGNRVISRDFRTLELHRSTIGIKSREQSLSHETLSPELGVADTSGDGSIETGEGETACCPSLCATDIGIIIIAVFVALLQCLGLAVLQIIIQIVLNHSRISRIIAFSELVNVHVIVTAEEVVQNLVILGTVPLV